jgi:hypothetical protein
MDKPSVSQKEKEKKLKGSLYIWSYRPSDAVVTNFRAFLRSDPAKFVKLATSETPFCARVVANI